MCTTKTHESTVQLFLNHWGLLDKSTDIGFLQLLSKQFKPSPEYHTSIMSIVAQKMTLPLSFQARTSEQISLTQTLNQTWRLSVAGGVEKPRWIIIGLQNDKSGSQEKNPAIFDHMDLTNTYILTI